MIIVSGYLILTAVDLIILIRMAYVTDRLVSGADYRLLLVSSCARSIMTFDIGLHEVCIRVGGQAYATS